MVQRTINYSLNGNQFASVLVYDDSIENPVPGIIMVPNWLGPTENALAKAKRIASDKYVVLLADVYGTDVRPTNTQEASKAAGELKGEDRTVLRERLQRAHTEMQALILEDIPLDAERICAIGFCFGGTAVLEMARSGSDIKAVVSFHGGLDNPNPDDVANIGCKILVLHGAADPLVPQSEVQAFVEEMNASNVDWQLMQFGGAVHSFTDPHTFMPGRAEYNPAVSKRAFSMMDAFLEAALSE